MKKIFKTLVAVTACAATLTACVEEYDPQSSTVTEAQAGNAPGSYDNFVATLTASLNGTFVYSGSSHYVWDFGYPAFFELRDVQGQDIIPTGSNNWFQTWYEGSSSLAGTSAYSQLTWTYYYKWIKNCNVVISMAGSDPDDDKKAGAGIAYALRAMFYQDLARIYANTSYLANPDAETVPIIKETTTPGDATNNPRATFAEMYEFILEDLDKAEELLADYVRPNKYTPDVTVVYGLKARAYLESGQWAKAEEYAKKAQGGYTLMDAAAYTSKTRGFNTPNDSWMFGLTYRDADPNILENDGDSSWGSVMCLEIDPAGGLGCGYASNYGSPMVIDRHLYETIPATDFRRDVFVDFAIDELPTKADQVAALAAYSDHPEWVYSSGVEASVYGQVGGLALKFRVIPEDESLSGNSNQYKGFVVAVPLMRVEEMYLIEAEAAGRQDEARGRQLLTTFAQTRDAAYTYGTHTDAYYNTTNGTFLNEVWWQRRVELWGEGFATFDIKRLQKGVIRSYAGSNHLDDFKWNMEKTPEWMNWCIVQTETNYNTACTNNPAPNPPSGDMPEYNW